MLIEVIWYDENQDELSDTDIYDEDTGNPTSWTRYDYQFAPVADAKYAKLRFYGCHSSDATAGIAKIDDVQFKAADIAIGTVSLDLNGFTTTETLDIDYRIYGNIVSLTWDSVSATSNLTGLDTSEDLPATLRPLSAFYHLCGIRDNGDLFQGSVYVDTDGSITFFNGAAGGALEGSFTDSGSKGVVRTTVTYILE